MKEIGEFLFNVTVNKLQNKLKFVCFVHILGEGVKMCFVERPFS